MTQFIAAKRLLRILWLLAIWIVVIGSLLPETSSAIQALNRLKISDKIEHFAAYAVLAFLPAIHERPKFTVAAVIGAIALGVILEFGQLYSGWRNFEIGDMLADAAGACFGVAAGIPMRSTEIIRSVFSKDIQTR